MTETTTAALSRDAFLGGKVTLWQPKSGYRAGMDPVLLAAAVQARSGQSVLELGCGVGAALICLAARCSDLQLTGVELQPDYAGLARRNAAENDIEARILTADLACLPPEIRQERFDFVLANPPYFRPGAHSRARDQGRSVAMGEAGTPLAQWVDVAARRLAPKGQLYMIQRADRVPDMLASCDGRLGSIQILPFSAREGRAPDLVILRARKGGRAAFRLHAPIVLHDGASHDRDGESYSAQLTGVLRHGRALDWPSA